MTKGKDKDTLIDSHVSLHQCRRAVEALHAYTLQKEQKAAETELLPGKEQHVWLQVAVKQMHPEKKLKPFKIPLVHPLVDPRISSICLITKDPQREYKDLIESHGIKFISRVVGVTKLKGKFKPYEARRMLLKENGMFLADDRVIPLLPGLLGSKWFEAKKQPIPVCLTRKDLKGELERAISSTYMHQNQGTCTSIKIATTTQSPSQALANLQIALPAIISNIKGGWDNVQSLHLKTGESVALPLWTCGLGEEGRWDGLVKDDESLSEDGVASDGEMDVDEVVVEEGKTAKGKGTKRPSKEEAQEEEKLKKKAKGTKRPPEEDVSEEEKPKKKAKGMKRPSEEEAQEEGKPKKVKKGVDSASEVTLDSPVSVKKKRKASLVPESIVAPETSTSVAVREADSDASKKKKKRKSNVADAPKAINLLPMAIDAAAEADMDTEPSEPIPNPKKEKRKSKSRASLDLGVDGIPAAPAHRVFVPVPKPEATEQANPKKQKKGRVSIVEADALMVAKPTETISVQPFAEAEVTIEPPSKKPKLNKKAKARLAAAATTDDNINAAPLDPVSAPATSDTPVDSEKKKKTKKSKALAGDKPSNDILPSVAGSDQATDATPLSLPNKTTDPASADALNEGKKKTKNAKPTGSEPVTGATATADAPEDGQSKKKKKKAKAAANVESAVDIVNAPVISTKDVSASANTPMETKRKKVKAAAGAESTNDTAPEDGEKKKTKKKNAMPAADAKPVHDYTTAAGDSATITEDPPTKKSRKQKKEAGHADVDMPVSNALSKDELKQKRLADGGERKKDKVVKKKGKSAKDTILGRKAGQA